MVSSGFDNHTQVLFNMLVTQRNTPEEEKVWTLFDQQILGSCERHAKSLAYQYQLNITPEELISILRSKFYIYYCNYPLHRPYLVFEKKGDKIEALIYGKKNGGFSVAPNEEKIQAWCKTSLTRIALSHSKSKRYKIVSFEQVEQYLSTQVNDFDFIEHERLHQKIQQLSPLNARLIQLIKLDDLSYDQTIDKLIKEKYIDPDQGTDIKKLKVNLRSQVRTAMISLRKLYKEQN